MNIKNLRKSFGSNPILKDISLEISAGKFVSLLGPSGSGKTSLLRCIAGLEVPEAGLIQIGDEVLSSPERFVLPEKRNIGMVFQNYALWPHMNVLENVAYPLCLRKDVHYKAKARQALDLVQLSSLEKRFPNEISGGQQQRVALARAIVASPRLLLLDEPLSSLDALLRDDLGKEIRSLQRELKLTTIMVTHDQREALSFSDYLVLLNHGSIDSEGDPKDLYQKPPTSFATEFLIGGFHLRFNDKICVVNPRKVVVGKSDRSIEVKIVKTFFRGHEYELWGESSHLSQALKFFSPNEIQEGSVVPVTIN